MGGVCSSNKDKNDDKIERSDDRAGDPIILQVSKKPCPTLASPDGSRIMTRRRGDNLEDVIKI